MKKTLLAVAMLIASTGVFAQLNINDGATKLQNNAQVKSLDLNALRTAKKTAVKGTAEGAEIFCTFDKGSYEIGTTARHTSPTDNGKWRVADSTDYASFAEGDPSYMAQFIGLSRGNGDILRDYANFSPNDGFAYVDWYTLGVVQHYNNTTFDSWIKFNEPINTNGLRGIDIYISQVCYHFNADRYFLEWSHSEDFAIKDSIEFNIRNVDVSSNSYILGTICVNVPNSTSNCKVISTDENEKTYFRIRVYSPADNNQPHGYFYLIDDIAWAEAPEERVEIRNTTWYNGYHTIPEIVSGPDTLHMQVIMSNTGTSDIYNAVLNNFMYKAEGAQTEEGNDTILYNLVGSNVSAADDTVSCIPYEVEEDSVTRVRALRRDNYMTAQSNRQLNSGVGTYRISTGIVYNKDNEQPTVYDTIRVGQYDIMYNIGDSLAYIPNAYRWARDCGTGSTNMRGFTNGLTVTNNTVYLAARAAYDQRGYKVCAGFAAAEYKGDVYAYGVELVPAINVGDSIMVRAGARIKASLMQYNFEATDRADLIQTVQWINDGENVNVESDVYTVTADNLNTDETQDSVGRLASEDLNKIYLPFNSQSTILEPDQIYYACYELVADGKFAVARDGRFVNIFGPGNAAYTIVYTPGLTNQQQAPWGTGLSPEFLENSCPMIRLIVSNQEGGLTKVENTTANVNMYPNPATDNAVLAYTLAKTGHVVINVTDIMGRTILSYDEGTQTAGVTRSQAINTSNFANGTYFCTINVDGEKTTTKFVVNK
ncbi:MAG: T9SS type A sorting domain-containing protein [Bacteroidales bacterium]|nr:T9SS type A sorting domain-containing protein [Bacteroidales bacterium]